MNAQAAPNDPLLPQILGEFSPVDVWQVHMNKVFYGLRGEQVRDFYQTFAAADFRLAFALATDYVQKVLEREKSKTAPSQNQPLTVMEWGCGNGNLAACFLDRVKELDINGTLYSRLEYILTDSSGVVLDGARANIDLKKHQDRIKFVQANVDDLQVFEDHSIDRIFCNELWSELSTKLVLRQSTEVLEEYLRPNLKETRLVDFPNWATFIQAFNDADIPALQVFPHFLEDIVWEREYHKIEAKDLPFRKLINQFVKLIDDEVLVPTNVGAAVSLRQAERLLAIDSLGFSSFDFGTIDRAKLNDPEKPCYGLHGGQFSFMVNFALLEEIGKQMGSQAIKTEPQKEFVGRCLDTHVISLMDVLASHGQLSEYRAWETDHLILQTMKVINFSYVSPYRRPIEFPITPEIPSEKREEIESLLRELSETGVPDTIAYLTEEEIFGVAGKLEELGYEREMLRSVLKADAQPIDYYHFSFTPKKKDIS